MQHKELNHMCHFLGQALQSRSDGYGGIVLPEKTVSKILDLMELIAGIEVDDKANPFMYAIRIELNKAKKAYPETDQFDINKMALVLSEEAGEVSKAVLDYQDEGGSLEEVKGELIQTAAMCLRMILNLENYK